MTKVSPMLGFLRGYRACFIICLANDRLRPLLISSAIGDLTGTALYI